VFGFVSCVGAVRVLSKQARISKGLVLGAGARCGSILQPSAKQTSKGLVSCRVLSKGAGLSYNQRLGVWCCGRVRCEYILQPSFSLVLGLVLRERIKSKE